MTTNIVIEDHIDPPHKGLTKDDITADDSALNVSANTRTSKGPRFLLAKTRARKVELLAKQRRQTERVALERKKLQLSTSSEVLEIEERKRRLALEQQKIHIKTEQKLQNDIEVEQAHKEVYAQYEEYKHLTVLSFPKNRTHNVKRRSVYHKHTKMTNLLTHMSRCDAST